MLGCQLPLGQFAAGQPVVTVAEDCHQVQDAERRHAVVVGPLPQRGVVAPQGERAGLAAADRVIGRLAARSTAARAR